MNDPNVISVGDDWREWPCETWGTQDRVQHAREERARAEAKAQRARMRPAPREHTPLAMGPGSDVGSFQLDPPRQPRRDARGREIDRLLEKVLGRR
jgi:hypothetical protein